MFVWVHEFEFELNFLLGNLNKDMNLDINQI